MPDDPIRRLPPAPAGGATTNAPRYCRARDLPGLIALWPAELRDTSPAARLRLLARLRRALRAERQRGSAGHWTYDLARHRQLLWAYRAEAAELVALLERQRRRSGRRHAQILDG